MLSYGRLPSFSIIDSNHGKCPFALGNVMKNLSGKKAKLIAGGLFVVMAGARYAPPN